MNREEVAAGPGKATAAGEDAAHHSGAAAELNGVHRGSDVLDGRINGATLACNAPTHIDTKVTTSSAERVRRHRARKKIAAQVEEMTFIRHDWALFLDPYRLPQKAGCRSDQVRSLALKELVDNGLDHAANVALAQTDKDTWSVADDGPGMDAAHTPEMIDIGLRLADVEEMDLQDEPAEDEGPATEKLEEYGASDEEIAFLFSAKRRVELNAMTSREFLDWLEGKLEEHGAGKVVPPLEMLETKARSAIALRLVSDRVAEIEDAARREAAAATLPDDLAGLVGRVLAPGRISRGKTRLRESSPRTRRHERAPRALGQSRGSSRPGRAARPTGRRRRLYRPGRSSMSAPLAPDPEAALAFLDLLHPGGPGCSPRSRRMGRRPPRRSTKPTRSRSGSCARTKPATSTGCPPRPPARVQEGHQV